MTWQILAVRGDMGRRDGQNVEFIVIDSKLALLPFTLMKSSGKILDKILPEYMPQGIKMSFRVKAPFYNASKVQLCIIECTPNLI